LLAKYYSTAAELSNFTYTSIIFKASFNDALRFSGLSIHSKDNLSSKFEITMLSYMERD
jgi:hypothetical protein